VKAAQQLAAPVIAATVSLVILLALRPLSTSRALGIWVVIVTALALLLLVRHSRSAKRTVPRFEAALQRGETSGTAEPVELLRMERELELGIASAGSAHHRLLPLLRTAAAARLASRHGIDLDRRPDAARALLGEEAWEWLRPDRSPPADRFGRGVPRERVTAVIELVESL
jgi:hypothetical protein